MAKSDPAAGKNRKERVLHTRIPERLEDELKSVAEALRMPVSNLVRSILEDAIDAADRAGERVETGLQRAARTVHDESERIAERVESSLHRAARAMHAERDRLTERAETEVERAAGSFDEESERLVSRFGQVVQRAARTVQDEGQRFAGRVAQVAQKVRAPAFVPAAGPEALAQVIAFQPVIVAVNTECAQCGRKLGVGDDAALGIGGDPAARVFVCGDCLPRKPGV
jgi:ElaB/YqjD/DUF883 family membrane-anchored ribosome-binding protein